MVLAIHDYHVVLMITPNGLGRSPGRFQSRSAVATIARLSRTCKGRHDAVGIHLADAVALSFTDVGIALTVHTNGAGAHNRGLGGRQAIAGPAFLPIPGKGGDDAGFQV